MQLLEDHISNNLVKVRRSLCTSKTKRPNEGKRSGRTITARLLESRKGLCCLRYSVRSFTETWSEPRYDLHLRTKEAYVSLPR